MRSTALSLLVTVLLVQQAKYSEATIGSFHDFDSGGVSFRFLYEPAGYVTYQEAVDYCENAEDGNLVIIEDADMWQEIHDELADEAEDRIRGKYWIAGYKPESDYPLVDTQDRFLQYHNLNQDTTALYGTSYCSYMEQGLWHLTDNCDGDIVYVDHFICMSRLPDLCSSPDCDPQDSINLDNYCYWYGDTDETYTQAEARCQSYVNGNLMPIYTLSQRLVVEGQLGTGNKVHLPLTIPSGELFYRWPGGDRLLSSGDVTAPFDIVDSEAVEINTFDASQRTLVWWSHATGKATFEDKATFQARALCYQPKEDYSCTFSIAVTYGSLATTSTTATVTCDLGYELPDGETGTYSCTCPERQVTGRVDCVDINECATYLCENGGTCNNELNYATCSCVPGFTGDHCEITELTPCTEVDCENGGSCWVNPISTTYTCVCLSGYTGVHCETNINECNPNPCQNGGGCTDGIAGFTCTCLAGYGGDRCEIDFDECRSNECSRNTARCIDGVNDYQCVCIAGFEGRHCETNINDCVGNPCRNRGRCLDGIARYDCDCQPGYTGRNCESYTDQCLQATCLNGGVCINAFNTYRCECPSGYTGSRCQSVVENCAGVVCLNGGQCFSSFNSFTCRCTSGFSGRFCEYGSTCSLSCQNGGVCVSTSSGDVCQCRAGYSGTNCEVDDEGIDTAAIIGGVVGGVVGLMLILGIIIWCLSSMSGGAQVAPVAVAQAPAMLGNRPFYPPRQLPRQLMNQRWTNNGFGF